MNRHPLHLAIGTCDCALNDNCPDSVSPERVNLTKESNIPLHKKVTNSPSESVTGYPIREDRSNITHVIASDRRECYDQLFTDDPEGFYYRLSASSAALPGNGLMKKIP